MAYEAEGPMEVIIFLDIVEADLLSQALDDLARRVENMVERLQADSPGFQLGILTHRKDSCFHHYRMKPFLRELALMTSIPGMVNFLTETEGTSDGDIPKHYALALNYISHTFSSSPGRKQILIIVGDAYPHEADSPSNAGRGDWRQEVDRLEQKGVKIYAVQVQNDDTLCTEFFTTLTEKTGGQLLKLTNMQRICEVIMGVCYREEGEDFIENFEALVREKQSETFALDMENVFRTLRREELRFVDPRDYQVNEEDTDDDGSKWTLEQQNDSANATPPQRQPRNRKPPSDGNVDKIPPKRRRGKLEMKSAPKRKSITFRLQARGRKRKASLSSNIRQRRERVFSTQFKYRHLAWSHWKLAVCPSDLQTKKWGDWKTVPQCGSKTALWRRDLLNSCPTQSRKSDKSEILFEASIIRPNDCRRRVVSSHISKAVRNFGLPWYRCLFRSVRHCLNEAAHDDCKVFLRWARVPSSQSSTISDLRSTYDYAWDSGRSSPEL